MRTITDWVIKFSLIVSALLCALIIACGIANAEVPTIAQAHGARLLAWTFDGKTEFSVFIPFDSATFTAIRRHFIAFNSAYSAGAYDVGFEREYPVQLVGAMTAARAHINAFDGHPPRLYFVFQMSTGVCFSDSLSFDEIFK